MEGYFIVISTVNPLSLASFFNFYRDMSHQKPIHPETLKFLLESLKFKSLEIQFLSHIPEDVKLKKVTIPTDSASIEKTNMETYNYNIDMLNQILWGPMDFALIGKK
jgi:O-antigen chain-terminating methyltransferase